MGVLSQTTIADPGKSKHALGHPSMGLHTKVALVARLRLMHLWITYLLLFQGRTRCNDYSGIHKDAPGDMQSLRLQALANRLKKRYTRQMSKIKDHAFLRHRLQTRINVGKTYQVRLIERFLRACVRLAEPACVQTAIPQSA